MPPRRSDKMEKLTEQENRLLLAIEAMKSGEYTSAAAAAKYWKVPVSTLKARIKGRESATEKRASGHIFTQMEEQSIENWLLDMVSRGAALTLPMLRDMANLLLSARKKAPSTTGINWPSQFAKRHPNLSTRLSPKHNDQKTFPEDPRVIGSWFDLLQKTIVKWGIASDDIYNFDESGYAMSVGATQTIITSAEYHGSRAFLQAGNREWVTSIECIRASGRVLPPLFVFKGAQFPQHLRSHPIFNHDGARLTMSLNGGATNRLGAWWLKHHFIPNIGTRAGKYCLLILNGHGGHLTPEFDQICEDNQIIAIYVPGSASHLLQPLDVGCFWILNARYGEGVSTLTRNGINTIDKENVIDLIANARMDAFTVSNIRYSFLTAGLVPFNAHEVLERSNVRLDSRPPRDNFSQRAVSSGSDSDPNSVWTPSNSINPPIRIQKDSTSLSSPMGNEVDSPSLFPTEATDQKITNNRDLRHESTVRRGILGTQEVKKMMW
ncbi:hypothetical protein N7513_003163 [Penicillium frequentans]|uniref:HTH CENPB-type domain-containing protein n=1 Tax=Penicillium frequentans TaxID=3151616 RepID=A0AAD6CH98_9EURO|nr:hypothetical protein N7494_013270 [Penicillium glabrum]KAJ5557577.1 hypothetical protein N7513_003163 [Penicillium glabrum]